MRSRTVFSRVGVVPTGQKFEICPDLPFSAFFCFPFFSLQGISLPFGAFFPFFPRISGVRQSKRHPCFFGVVFLVFPPKRQGKEDQGGEWHTRCEHPRWNFGSENHGGQSDLWLQIVCQFFPEKLLWLKTCHRELPHILHNKEICHLDFTPGALICKQTWLLANFMRMRSFTFFCALLRTCFCAHLRSFACFCVRPRLEWPRVATSDQDPHVWPQTILVPHVLGKKEKKQVRPLFERIGVNLAIHNSICNPFAELSLGNGPKGRG